jgi:hypothetical protein
MASKVHYEVETRLTCDRCKTEVIICSNLNPQDGKAWLTLQTPQVIPKEFFDLCPQCAQDFRKFVVGEK